MQIHKNELGTGILVLVTLGILIAVLLVVGMPGVVRPLKTYRIYYDNANGIRPGAPVLLAGREIGKVTLLESPVALDKRPKDHADFEVSIDVQVAKDATIYRNATARLTQQGLMGQQVIDFVRGDANTGLAENHSEFVGDRVPDITESVNENMKRLTGPESDLALTIKNTKTFVAMLNKSPIPQVIENAEQLTDVLKKEPWRLLWPSKPPTAAEAPGIPPKKPKLRPEDKRSVRAPAPKAQR
jgi:phospholipid/cholesterol/gamma-HCH transport system substrate-binding protein